MAKCLQELHSIISVFVQLSTWLGIRGSQLGFARPPGCLGNFGAFTSIESLSKWVTNPKSFCTSAEKDPGPLTVNIQVLFYIINEYILFGRKLFMPIMESYYGVSAVVKQILPPTIQQMHGNTYNRARVAGGDDTQEKCQQSFGDAGGPAAGWTGQQRKRRCACAGRLWCLSHKCRDTAGCSAHLRWPPGMLTADERRGAEPRRRGRPSFGCDGQPLQPRLRSHHHLAQRHRRLAWAEWVCQTAARGFQMTGDRLGLRFSITPRWPKPVALPVGPCIPVPSLASAPALRQPWGTPVQKHPPLTVQPPVAGGGV